MERHQYLCMLTISIYAVEEAQERLRNLSLKMTSVWLSEAKFSLWRQALLFRKILILHISLFLWKVNWVPNYNFSSYQPFEFGFPALNARGVHSFNTEVAYKGVRAMLCTRIIITAPPQTLVSQFCRVVPLKSSDVISYKQYNYHTAVCGDCMPL